MDEIISVNEGHEAIESVSCGENSAKSSSADISVNWSSQQSLLGESSNTQGTTVLSSQKLKAKYIDMFHPYNDEEDLWTQIDRLEKEKSEKPVMECLPVTRDYHIPGNESIIEPDPPLTEKQKQDKVIAENYWERVANCNPDIGVPLLQTPQAVWDQFKDVPDKRKSPSPPHFDYGKYTKDSPDRSTQIQTSQDERQAKHDTDKWVGSTIPRKKRLINEFTPEEIYAAKRIKPDCRMFKKCMQRKKK